MSNLEEEEKRVKYWGDDKFNEKKRLGWSKRCKVSWSFCKLK